ncbi:hypothetical protein A1353_21580 [Methylomonas methanica]|uniref:Uncharacterized protein n=1 Tax=Methylomonas methanica TaxID=421 RepID=A0A177M2D7_METMH|nr:hypothetical protein [Methylomonas methanica]OAH98968.1 hypothetical protein A1353_21580 [Methylomonas methanica]
MRVLQIAAGGIVAGLLIVAGEAVLNLLLLADEWAKLFSQLALPQPTVAIAAQGVLKLILLGFFSVWLAITFKPAHVSPRHAGIVTGLIVWFLVWAWVQWGMLLAGYVSPTIAVTTVVWGFIELPLAVWAGVSLYHLTWRPTGARL